MVSTHASCNCLEQLLQNLDNILLLSYSDHCNLLQDEPQAAATCLTVHLKQQQLQGAPEAAATCFRCTTSSSSSFANRQFFTLSSLGNVSAPPTTAGILPYIDPFFSSSLASFPSYSRCSSYSYSCITSISLNSP